MDQDQHRQFLAYKARLTSFLSGYPSMINAGDLTVDAYVRAVFGLSFEAVDAAILRYVRGQVPGQRIGWPPDQTEFYIEAQKHEPKVDPDIPIHNGMLHMDFGHGRVDLRGLTADEQDAIIAAGGKLNGKNAALMSLEQKKAALGRYLSAPVAA